VEWSEIIIARDETERLSFFILSEERRGRRGNGTWLGKVGKDNDGDGESRLVSGPVIVRPANMLEGQHPVEMVLPCSAPQHTSSRRRLVTRR
jgi:hypothetical protein